MKYVLVRLYSKIVLFRKKLSKKLRIGHNVYVSKGCELEGGNYISTNTELVDSFLGYGSYIGVNCVIKKSWIGKFTSIGPFVKVISGSHPTGTIVSSHPAFYSLRKQSGFTFVKEQYFEEFNTLDGKYSVRIGHDVWIGADVTILEGVTIGDGAIIASKSLVNKDVPNYSIVGGVPAKTIKNRFSDDDIRFLMEFQWWNKGNKWLKSNAHLFQNVRTFVQNLENK